MMAHPSLCSDATDVGRSIDVVSDYSSVASSGYAYGLGANVLLSVSSTRSMRHEVGMATAREYRRANSDTTTQTWRTPRAPVSQRRHSVPARLDHSNTWNPSFMDATVRALLKCNRRSIPRKHTLHSGGGGGGGGDAKRSKAQRVSGQHSLSPHSASRGKKGIAPNARNSPVRDVQERDAAPRVASRRPSANAKRAANAKPLPDSQQQSNAPTKRNSQSAPEGPNSERSGSTLPAKCKFCNVIVPRKEVLTHNLICPLKTFQCNLKDSETGEKCLVFCRGKDMLAEHQARCSYRRHICANEGCKRQVSVRSTSLHLAGCEYRRATCSQCGASYPRIQHDAHLLVCPEVLVQCPLLCGQVMRRETVPHHMLTEAAEHAIVPFPDPRVCGSDSGRMTTALLARLIQRNGDAEAVLREYTDHIRNHSPREQPLKKEEREHSLLERSSSGSARDSHSRKGEEKQSASVKPDSRAAVEITPTASLDVDPLHTVSLSPPRDDGHAATSALKVAPAPKPQGSPASLGLPPPSPKRRLSTTTGERTNSAPVVAQQLALSPQKLSLSKVEPVPNVSAPSPTVIRKVRTSNASPHQAPIKGVAESKRTNGTSAFAAPLEERSTSTGSTATTTGSIATLEVNQNSRLRSKSNNSTSSPLLDPRVRRGSSSGLKCAADAETAATVVPRPTARSLSNSLRQSDEMSDSSTDNSARGQENVELASIAKTIARRERKLEKLFSALDEFCDNSNEPFRSGQNGHGSAADSEDRGKARLKARSEKMEKKMGDIDRRVKSLMSRESTLNLNNTLHVVDAWRQLESRWYTIKLLYHDALDM